MQTSEIPHGLAAWFLSDPTTLALLLPILLFTLASSMPREPQEHCSMIFATPINNILRTQFGRLRLGSS